MKYSRIFLSLWFAGLSLATQVAQATDEDLFLGQIHPPQEQAMGHGRSALWTMPLVATQYQPLQPTPAMQAALQAQREGRFLDALALLDEAGKSGQGGADTEAEMTLLRASFLLQGNQSRQALENLAPLLADTRHATDAYALTAMAHLQLGQMQQALESAKHAQTGEGMLPPLALSYALQGAGRLEEARDVMHGFNTRTPQAAIALAREAELSLTLYQLQAARTLAERAHETDAAQPYVIAMDGLIYLLDGKAQQAKAAFESALKRDPKDAKALLGLGLAEIKLGNFQAGQEKLQAADAADPGNALILTYLGRSQQNLGQTGAARASWRSAQQADPKDPVPWLYQAQAELQANRPLDAHESLREAQARLANRKVYRGERLLKEDEQLLQANLAEVQRQLGLEGIAFQTLSASPGEKDSTNLRNQADLLQGQRFGESARHSLLLQSLFNERPGNLPSALDIYGDLAGQTGAASPQHGVVDGLGAEQASYNNYDELFNRRTTLEANATTGSQNTNGEQIRVGVGSDTLGLGVAQLQFKTDGNAPFENLDNRVGQAIVQWRPTQSTQAFVSQETFNSKHGEIFYPADPILGGNAAIENDSEITRVGLRHTLTDGSELRGLLSHQQTFQTVDNYNFSVPPKYRYSSYGSSDAHGEELQYRRSGATYATQWGVQQFSGPINYWYSFPGVTRDSLKAQQLYAAWRQTLNPYWQLEAGLGWGKIDVQDNHIVTTDNSTYLARWLPQLGVVYTPDSGAHLRFAAWQGMGVPAVGDATLAPTSLAGVLLARPGDNGQLVKAVSLGGDKQLSPAWLLDAQTQRRLAEQPVIDQNQWVVEQQVDESKLALHWQPQGNPWVVSLAYDYERVQNDPGANWLDSVQEQSLRSQQLDMRWFASAQCAVNLAWSHNQAAGTQQTIINTSLIPFQDSFNQVDANMSWKFYGSRGLFTAGVRNATNTSFQYTDIDPLNPRFSNGRLTYAKLKMAW